eukprot:5232102-Pyramimonas_sp.AAC.1
MALEVGAVGGGSDDVHDVCKDDVPVVVGNDDAPVVPGNDDVSVVVGHDDVPVVVGNGDVPEACGAPLSGTSPGTSWGTTAD